MTDPKLFVVLVSGRKPDTNGEINLWNGTFIHWASSEDEAVGAATRWFLTEKPDYWIYKHSVADATPHALQKLVFPHVHTETPARQALDLLYSEVITSGFRSQISKTALDAARAVVRPQTTTPTPADPLENASERPRSAPTTPAATQAPPSHHERLENALRKAEELQEELRLLFPHKFQRNSTINVSMHNLLVNLRPLVQDSQA